MTRFPAIVPRSHTSRARLMALGALALVAAAAAVILFVRGTGPPGPDEALDPFLAAWTRGDDRGAAAITTDPRAAGASLVANRRGLDGAGVHASARAVDQHGDSARATVLMRWDVPGIGVWTYRTRVALQRRDGHWKVLWRPTVVHPRLTATRRLGTVRDPAARAPILDRQGRTLVSARAVVRVGIDRATVSDIDATATALAGVVDVDGTALARAARRAGPKQFVEAVTLRASDYAPLAERVQAIQGAQVVEGTAQLAPSRTFARALLGGVGPATAEQIKRSRASRDRRRRRPVGPGGPLPGPAGGDPGAPIVIRDHRGAPSSPCCAAPRARASSWTRRSIATSSRRPRRRWATARRSRAGRRAALDRRHPRGGQPPDGLPPTIAPSTAATRLVRRSRSSPRRRCCARG